MAQFTGFQGNILETTPLKTNTAHGGDDLSLSELATTPQFRWMGEAAPATPGSYDALNGAPDSTMFLQEEGPKKDLDVSFDETLRFEHTVLDEGDAEEADRTQSAPPASASTEAQELDNLKYTLRTMNKSVTQLNGFLKACIPKFQRMQNAIETWDGLSKQYNQIMIEAERTAQILEDPSWPGRVKEEARYRQSLMEDEEREQEGERRRELEMQRQEEERLVREEKERLGRERQTKQQPVARGRGRGRGTGIPMRGMGDSASRSISRGSGIGRGISVSSSSRPTSSTFSRGSSTATRGRFS